MNIEVAKGTLDSNTFVASEVNLVILFDAGARVSDVKKIIGKRSVSAIFLTHEHFDHITYIADYIQEFDCPIYCHSVIIDDLRLGDFQNNILKPINIPKNFENFVPITSEKEITVGLFRIKPFFCTGHSIGSIVFLMHGHLFTGDVLFAMGIGRTDFIRFGERLMLDTLEKLQDIEFEIAHHGHGKSTTYKEQKRNIRLHLG
ncbi:MAG: MBL fold metallo-hydrolase [Firmicutes bacterium]|nr:MBL fold metallo-hydrolase [Bacillota bacterium]